MVAQHAVDMDRIAGANHRGVGLQPQVVSLQGATALEEDTQERQAAREGSNHVNIPNCGSVLEKETPARNRGRRKVEADSLPDTGLQAVKAGRKCRKTQK